MNSDNSVPLKGYKKTFHKSGESPKALQWQDYRSAAIRYRQLLQDVDVEGRSILDIGCGMGDLLPYIYAKSDNFNYLGVDVIEKFIEVAKKRYLGHDFRVLNPFTKDLEQTFDVVVACGALNAPKTGWLENRQQKIKRLYELANQAVAFNMAGSFEPGASGDRVAQADVRQILEFCTKLTPKVILKTHYHPKDFTIVMFK